MEQSRTKKATRNIFFAFVGQFSTQILNFVVRTVFIRMLTVEYLGINGLFANVLSVLSLAELGFGASVIYSMYAPMAQGDIPLVQAYMSFYQKVYRIIGIGIIAVGVVLTPFLDIFVSERPSIEYSLELIFLLYIIKTAGSYFFAYKTCILTVDQKSYVLENFSILFTVIKSIFLIIVLVLTRNFLLYTVIEVIFVFVQNLAITLWCEKKYKFLKQKAPHQLSKESKKTLISNVKAMFLHKVASVVLNSSDNIIISKLIGVVAVGFYSNYSAVIVIIRNVIYTIFNALIPSIGNLCASSSKKQVKETFYQVYFIVMWMTGFCTTGIILLMNDFVCLWAGEKYVMHYSMVIVLAISFYIQVSMRAVEMFRTATGLFYNDRYVAVAQCLVNVVISILMVKYYGIQGVFVGTSLAMLTTLFWVQPVIFYKKVLEENVKIYFLKYIFYTLEWGVILFVDKWILEQISLPGWGGFIVSFICVVIFSNLLMICFSFKSPEFQCVLNRIVKGKIGGKK